MSRMQRRIACSGHIGRLRIWMVLAIALPVACSKPAPESAHVPAPGAAATSPAPQPVAVSPAAPASPAAAAAPPPSPPAIPSSPEVPSSIDEEPAETAESVIADRRDDTVSGHAACAFNVRYKGAINQPVVWNGQPCRNVNALFMGIGKLKELGRYDSLAEEVRDDIARSGGRALYIEGGATASLYPLNSAGRIYRVPLAD